MTFRLPGIRFLLFQPCHRQLFSFDVNVSPSQHLPPGIRFSPAGYLVLDRFPSLVTKCSRFTRMNPQFGWYRWREKHARPDSAALYRRFLSRQGRNYGRGLLDTQLSPFVSPTSNKILVVSLRGAAAETPHEFLVSRRNASRGLSRSTRRIAPHADQPSSTFEALFVP